MYTKDAIKKKEKIKKREMKCFSLELDCSDTPSHDDVVHQDPVEVRGDDHFLTAISDTGCALAEALAGIVDKETSE